MASTLVARQALNVIRLSTSSRSASLIQRRGLSGATDPHGPKKVDFWEDPMNPSRWKDEHFFILSLGFCGVILYGEHKAKEDEFDSLSRDDAIRRPPRDSANATKRIMEIIVEESETRTMLESLRLLSEPVSTQLPPEQYNLVMKARAKLQKKYAKAFDSSDIEE